MQAFGRDGGSPSDTPSVRDTFPEHAGSMLHFDIPPMMRVPYGIRKLMSEEALSPTKPSKKPKKTFSPEQARAQILAKLEKAGAKGSLSPVTAKTPEAKRVVFEHVLGEMEAAQTIFVDRRKAKARLYLWAVRPRIPTRESVAAVLEDFAAREFPRLLAPADLKSALGKDKDAQALLSQAVELLAAERRLIAQRYQATKKKMVELYSHAESLRKVLAPVAPMSPQVELAPVSPEAIHRAYHTLIERTGFPAVPISLLQQESAAPLEALKRWLVEEYKSGGVVLSSGDWSLADDAKRSAAVEIGGERYLLARLML